MTLVLGSRADMTCVPFWVDFTHFMIWDAIPFFYCSGIQLDENLEQMQQGTMMRKVKSKNWKKQRFFLLKDDCMTVWYKSKMSGNAKSAFSVSDVETVREGHQSEVLQSLAEEFPAECCFTVVFHGRRNNLDLIAGSAEEAQCWIQGLQRLVEIVTNMDQREKIDQWICDWFQKADKDKDGRMNFKEVQHLLRMMNVDMNEDHAYRLFQMADKSETGTLEGEEFVLFYKALTQRDEVLEIFQEYSEDGKKLTLLEFVDFLQQEQMESNGTDELAMELIDRYEPSETAKARHVLSTDGFLMYLCSPDGSIFNPEHRKVYQDMSQPLCHYFISSSHNTYLMEDQLRGQSSVEGYIRALKRGCRCLEVDCWDGSNGEPIVYHGHTFTSKILFREVVTTLEKYAFRASEYPVILSIENHCSIEQQDIMAQQLKGILGEQLLLNTIDGRVPMQLPSPEELKGKIILKGKKIGYLEDSLNEQPDEMPEQEYGEEEAVEEEEGADPEEEALRNEDKRKEKKTKQSLSKELSDCIIYCKSVPFCSFQHSRSHYKPYEMSSFAESKTRKLIREAGNDFVRHNAWQLTRIFPSGLRTDSSNYNPQIMWNVGCQMVALNFQTAGTEMDLYDGLFSQNGGCGYVLKPSFMRESETTFSPENPQSSSDRSPLNLVIKVISGQQLPKMPNSKEGSIVDPLVRVEIHGVPGDNAKQETKYIDNNGFNPQWGEIFQFQVWVPELSLLRFVVEDYDKASRNDFVGQYTLPLTSVKPGYRHIHLLSKDGTGIPPASIFVHIRLGELSTESK
ncbi:1-phosphatidylinositol 4,5-bisphosphate phosphodiesterase delta-4 isoform X1 [Sceloporus undulatus]|uniref:1-phosphatidylinositol 4,5-bisphosphate phosphodiesterase delta-4 isoform X1 n=1 Tax=Sceloporus undulatus TaxID=8520 RepID=UPI001C4AB410|nr:1-phosphatidylinositol 4,5-bisphosphate phosphodiesterase delta-4 isoform X1 [Sceloporus undulatus]XP_042309601.1 1-phosphatidylinositol 4,5-bisphosphate phosphodiesterase delta-4 isoform X1 [Sceloporus undulatus]